MLDFGKRPVLVALVLAACAGRSPPERVLEHRAQAGDLAIVGATLVPMQRTGTVAGQTVLVRGDRIVLVAPDAEVDVTRARVIDGRGKWLVPGLADMHVHTQAESDLALYLLNGVTTVRDLFGSPQHLKWRDAIAEGKLEGPTLIAAGPIIDGDPPVWPGSDVVTTAEQARAAVQAQKQAGYDWIKVYNGLSVESYEAILAEAKAQGLPVGGHVPNAVGIERAIAGGQRTIEHLEGYVGRFGGRQDDEIVAATAAADLWNCATLVVTDRLGRLEDVGLLGEVRGLDFVPAVTREGWKPENDFRLRRFTPEIFAKLREMNLTRRALVGRLAEAGAKLVVGTDTGNPYVIAGFAVHDELALLVDAGLPRWGALRAATVAPSEMLGAPGTFGVIVAGARADLLLVDGDPLVDLGALAEPSVVIVRGKPHARDELLARAREATQPAGGDRFAKLPAIEREGEPIVAATYDVLFRDQVVGRERVVLSRTADGARVVRGQAVFDPPQKMIYQYRATRDSLDAQIDDDAEHVIVSRQGGDVVATHGKDEPIRFAAAADAVIAPQAVAEFFWYAESLAGLKVGETKTLEAAEVITERGLSIVPGTFAFVRQADEEGRRVYEMSGQHGELSISGRFSVDADGAPHEVSLSFLFGSFAVRRR